MERGSYAVPGSGVDGAQGPAVLAASASIPVRRLHVADIGQPHVRLHVPPVRGGDQEPASDPTRRLTAWASRAAATARLTLAGPATEPPSPRARRALPGGGRRSSDRSPRDPSRLAVYVYASILVVAGAAALAGATTTLPFEPGIELGDGPPVTRILLGLAFWTVVACLGTSRTSRFRGHFVVTFDVPFVVAAMTLGGPVAAGWVALLGTIELRELREAPWYGVLANHFGLALAAVAGGLAMFLLRDLTAVAPVGGTAGGELFAVVVGTAVFTTMSTGLTLGAVVLRDHLTVAEFFSVFDRAHRSTAAAEAVLGWLLALTFRSVGWWATVVCGILVLATWDAYAASEAARTDPLSGLLNRRGLGLQLDRAVRRAHRGWERGVLVNIDLDGFKAINDTFGHDAGDAVIRVTGERLKGAIRLADSASRLGGDEFAVVFLGPDDERTALALAHRLLRTIAEPISHEGRTIRVGASLGVAMLRSGDPDLTADALQRLADAAMYEAKRAGGGVHVHGPECPGSTLRPTPSPAYVRPAG